MKLIFVPLYSSYYVLSTYKISAKSIHLSKMTYPIPYSSFSKYSPYVESILYNDDVLFHLLRAVQLPVFQWSLFKLCQWPLQYNQS